jgi:hypothetical protein
MPQLHDRFIQVDPPTPVPANQTTQQAQRQFEAELQERLGTPPCVATGKSRGCLPEGPGRQP